MSFAEIFCYLVTECCSLIYTKKFKEWQLVQNVGAKMFFSHKNDVQSVATSDKRHIDIRLDQCEIRRSCSSG